MATDDVAEACIPEVLVRKRGRPKQQKVPKTKHNRISRNENPFADVNVHDSITVIHLTVSRYSEID